MNDFFAMFTDKANLIGAAIVTVLTATLGVQWPVFAFFLVLNVLDFYYGRAKAKKTNTLSSAKGADGIRKKTSYWVMIALAFAASSILSDLLGPKLGVDLGFLTLIGWFTLAVYILNELTSIVENLVVLGYDVPAVFVKGLAAMKSVVDAQGNKVIPDFKPKERGLDDEHN